MGLRIEGERRSENAIEKAKSGTRSFFLARGKKACEAKRGRFQPADTLNKSGKGGFTDA